MSTQKQSERYAETKYGFQWGAAEVTRLVSDKGHVVIGLLTERHELVVRVTPSGLIRVGSVQKRTLPLAGGANRE